MSRFAVSKTEDMEETSTDNQSIHQNVEAETPSCSFDRIDSTASRSSNEPLPPVQFPEKLLESEELEPPISAFEAPEGFGTVQAWDASLPLEPDENVGEKYMEEFPVLSSSTYSKKAQKQKSETTPKQSKPENTKKKQDKVSEVPKMKILQRKKVTYENFDVTLPFCRLDDGTIISYVQCFKESGKEIGFVFLSKPSPSYKNNECSVAAVYCTSTTSRQEMYDIVKNLVAEWKQKSKTMREIVNNSSLPILKTQYIVPLEKTSTMFPDALYYCELCDYHLNSISHIKSHFDEQQHFEKAAIKEERESFVNAIPPLLQNQRLAINALLENIIDTEDCASILHRKNSQCSKSMLEIATEIQTHILKRLANIEEIQNKAPILNLLGSVNYHVEHPDSDINFSLSLRDLPSEEIYNAVQAIELDFLSKENPFTQFDEINVVEGAHPRISMQYLVSSFVDKIPVTIFWGVEDKVLLGNLFRLYTTCCPKLVKLIKVVRLWARICNIMPPHGLHKQGFDLMVIHFLQTRRLLPVLGTASTEVQEENQFEFDLAEEFVGFFGYYSRKLDNIIQIEHETPIMKRDTKWNNKTFQIKAPFREDNVVSFPKTFQPYFLNCFISTFVYFVVPRNRDGQPIIEIRLYSNMVREMEIRKQKKWEARRREKEEQSRPNSGVDAKNNEVPEEETGEYRVKEETGGDPKLLKHEQRWQQEGKRPDEDPSQFIISKVDESLASKGKKKRHRKRTGNGSVQEVDIEPKTNEDFPEITIHGHSVNDLKAENIEIDDAREGYRQYSREFMYGVRKLVKQHYKEEMPPVVSRSIEDAGISKTTCLKSEYNKDAEKSDCNEDVGRLNDEMQSAAFMHEAEGHSLDETIENITTVEELAEQRGLDDQAKNKPSNLRFSQDDFRIRVDTWPLNEYFKTQAGNWDVDDYGYKLDTSALKYFTNEYLADIRCQHCDSNKHKSLECPEMKIPEIVDINYERGADEWKYFNTIIKSSYEVNCLPKEDLEYALKTVNHMQTCLQKIYPGSRLELFGSMRNGFGTSKSDVDICFRFENDQPPENENLETVISQIAKVLKNNFMNISVQIIINAKVPIVKFKIRKPRELEGDISYYNTLALTNTKMLCQYTEWDSERVPQLGLWIKKWAKMCDIGDASRGSLSSYSYIIMMIHYLQNCEPPVLPRLQEEFRKGEPPVLHGEWDIYYHNEIVHAWSGNTQTTAELFVGFLDYYSRFDYKNLVIQIRRQTPLTKLEKNWNRPICLEDPFDLRHNLGSGVSTRMYVHIMKTFRKSREIFMNRIDPKDYLSFVEYGYQLLRSCTPGKAPMVRLCHYCFRVGHYRETCPRRLEQERFNQTKYRGERRNEGRGDHREYRGRGNKEGGTERRGRRGEHNENEQRNNQHVNYNKCKEGHQRNSPRPNEGL